MVQVSLFNTTPLTYNTDVLSQEQKPRVERNALSQEKRVLAFADAKGSFGVTRSECYTQLALKGEVETSFGRALTNLVKSGELIKTEEKRLGAHGADNFVYKCADA